MIDASVMLANAAQSLRISRRSYIGSRVRTSQRSLPRVSTPALCLLKPHDHPQRPALEVGIEHSASTTSDHAAFSRVSAGMDLRMTRRVSDSSE